MKRSLTLLVLAFLSLSSATAFSQAAYFMVYDAKGQVTARNEYVDVTGSPYLSPDWVTGSFTLANGKSYSDMKIKYDLVKDMMYVKGGDDDLIRLLEPVKEFKLNVPVSGGMDVRFYKSGYSNIPNTTNSYFFEVLADGKTQLLKKATKIVQVNKEYNSATATKSFEDITKYYIYADGKGTLVKKDKKSILAALGSKQTELEAYIKENKLNLKSDVGFAKLIEYYNRL